MSKPAPVHYQPAAGPSRRIARFGGWFLWCTGRHTDHSAMTAVPDEITCRSCQRKFNKQVAAALAAYWGVPA